MAQAVMRAEPAGNAGNAGNAGSSGVQYKRFLSAETQTRNERIALLISGPGALVGFILGWFVLCGFVPTPSPTATGEVIAEMYRSKGELRMMSGIIITTMSGNLLCLWLILMALQVRRIEGRWGILSLGAILLGAMNTMLFMVSSIFLLEPAFRPDLPASTTLAVWDLGMLFFYQPAYNAVIELVLVAIAIFQDRDPNPVFPRWSGYFTLGILGIFSIFIFEPFFKTGPLSWTGAIGFWIALSAYFVWLFVETVCMYRAGYSGNDRGDELSGEPA